MHHKLLPLFVFLSLVSLLLAPLGASAQATQPPVKPGERLAQEGSRPGENRQHIITSDEWAQGVAEGAPWAAAHEPMEASATGGPDAYGYTWDDGVAYNWVNATGGTHTQLGDNYETAGPIPLPFSFKFYENTYTSLYISKYGYIGFTGNLYNSQSQVPSPEFPDNVIAPYWAPALVQENGYSGGVYYLTGGTAPNRYMAIEWYKIHGNYYPDNNIYTFEVLLYENGQILFQYNTMTYGNSYVCGGAGIEDDEGLVGLEYGNYCERYASNKAVLFTRPGPAVHVKVTPRNQGLFISGLEATAFKVNIRNTGELGADTMDLSTTGAWPVTLYRPDGHTPLTDTDGDGLVDTGSLAQDTTLAIIAKVQTPPYVNIGDANTAGLMARSSLNTSITAVTYLRSAVPAPFAQIYTDETDYALSQYLVGPHQQTSRKATPDNYYPWTAAVAEGPDGKLVSAWLKGRCPTQNCDNYVEEIEYTLQDHNGNTLKPITRLVDHSGATVYTYDEAPALAFTPDGHIGILWYRYRYDSSVSKFNYNIWLAILDSAGNLSSGPLNLTNNNDWQRWSDAGATGYYQPAITATGDNRFVLGWTGEVDNVPSSGDWVEDIFYAIRQSDGSQVKGVTKLTDSVPDGRRFYSPSVAGLTGNRIILVYHKHEYGVGYPVQYTVIDSAGNTVKTPTALGSYAYYPDAVQLSDGKILVAWEQGGITFAILDGSAYNLASGPTNLSNPDSVYYDYGVSVTADRMGHGILTWMDEAPRNLYYASVNSNGSMLSQPMIFQQAQTNAWGEQSIGTSYTGNGNTSYTDPVGYQGVDAYLKVPAWVGAQSAGTANIPITFGNTGMTTADQVVITATLHISLTYLGDTLGIPPTFNGNVLTWSLPTGLDYDGLGKFNLSVGTPASPLDTQLPVVWEIGTAGPEDDHPDNIATVMVTISRQLFLPLALR